MRYIIPLVILIVLVFFLWEGLAKDPYQLPSPLVNKPVPNFVASNLLKNRPKITKKLFLGHWSLLVVWSSWCLTCSEEQAFLLALKQNNKLKIYGLNYRDDTQLAQNWLKQYGNAFDKIIFDPNGLLAIDLGVYGVPESFLIDPQGIIRYKQVGSLNKNIWQSDIVWLMNSKIN